MVSAARTAATITVRFRLLAAVWAASFLLIKIGWEDRYRKNCSG
jgi:hypothetical protein